VIHGTSLFFELFNNLAIFIVLIAIYSYMNSLFNNRRSIPRQLFIGVSFGLIAIICMQVKIHVYEGVVVDQRNAIVILAGAFGGPISGIITAIFAGVYRIHLGGMGMWGGCFGVTLAAIAGSIIHVERPKIDTIWKAAIAALVAAIFILPGFLPIGSLKTGWDLTRAMALPYGLAIFVGMFLTGLLLALEEYRHSMKSQLTQSEKRYRELFESLIDVSVRLDPDDRITIISPSCEKMFGYSQSELIGKFVTDFYHPTHSDDMQRELVRTNGHIDNVEIEVSRKDGRRIWVSINAKALIDNKGEFAGAEAILRDISPIKKALEEKTQLQDNLRQSQKMQSIGTLAGGIAHDFNNSLTGIVGGAEILRNDSLPLEQRHIYVNLIMKAAQRAGELTKQLLAFSRKGDKLNKPVDIAAVVSDTIAILQRTINKKITISSKFLAGSTWVMGDSALLQNVFLNLGINADHAMPEGGSLIFTIDTKELSEKYCQLSPFEITSGRYLEISVADTGCGMTPEVLSRIFEPFFTTKQPGKGTGLGLAAVYGAIQDHHGAIMVTSEVGQGAVFRVYLPFPAQLSEQSVIESPAPHGSGVILFIDDEDLVRTAASMLLSQLGYKVLTAQNGQAGLVKYKENRSEVRLVILDMVMPVMGGRETFEELHEIDPTLPVIITTGFSGEKDLQALLNKGVAGIIHKPFTKLEIAEMVAKFLSTGKANN
jgi:PAS domain S-box-containing protein